MSVFRQRRFQLFILVTAFLGMMVWQPWSGLEPGLRGLSPGTEFTGGTQTLVKLESSLVTIKALEEDLDEVWTSIRETLAEGWGTSLISKDPENLLLVVEIGGIVSENYLRNRIGAYGEILSIEAGISEETVDEVLSTIYRRLDPYGLGGAQVRTITGYEAFYILGHWKLETSGKDMLLIETPADFPSTETVWKEGRLEIALGDQLLIRSPDIVAVGKPSTLDTTGFFPVYFTAEAQTVFNEGVRGREDAWLVVYLDRPYDSVLIFDNTIVTDLVTLVYDENKQTFWETRLGFHLLNPVLRVSGRSLHDNARKYLEMNADEMTRVVLIGGRADFPEEGFLDKIPPTYQKVWVEKKVGELDDDWIGRACGLTFVFPVSRQLAEEGIQDGLALPVAKSFEKAREIRTRVLYSLPTRITFVEETDFGPPIDEPFSKFIVASLLGAFGVSLLIICRYRQLEVGELFFAILMCDFVITLGLVSIMRLRVGFDEMAGIAFVLSISAGQLIVITNELIGEIPREKRASIGWRVPKVLSFTYRVMIFITVATMGMIGLGIRATWSFALIFLTGIFLTTVLSKSAYARILDWMYSRAATSPASTQ
jgi:preprotein translocase subunit SecF